MLQWLQNFRKTKAIKILNYPKWKCPVFTHSKEDTLIWHKNKGCWLMNRRELMSREKGLTNYFQLCLFSITIFFNDTWFVHICFQIWEVNLLKAAEAEDEQTHMSCGGERERARESCVADCTGSGSRGWNEQSEIRPRLLSCPSLETFHPILQCFTERDSFCVMYDIKARKW